MKKEKNKGITLIALIITIIVLIILAGISINLLLGENGLIQKAKDAAKAQEQAEIKEKIALDITAIQIENEGTITQKEVENILKLYGTVNKNPDNTIKSIKPTDREYEIPFSQIYSGNLIQTAQWGITDNDSSGGLSIGDLVTPNIEGIENEQFYVIDINGTGDAQTATLLSKICVKTKKENESDETEEIYIQSSRPNFVQFNTPESRDYIYANSTIRVLAQNYANKLQQAGLKLENVEITENGIAQTEIKGRLMWKSEAENSEFTAKSNASNILYSLGKDYFLGSYHPETEDDVWHAECSKTRLYFYGVHFGFSYGLRPVIKVLTSNIE